MGAARCRGVARPDQSLNRPASSWFSNRSS